MPDETEPNQLEKVANNAETNAEVAAKLADQDQSLKNTPAMELGRTSDALDALVVKTKEAKEKEDAVEDVEDKIVAAKKDDKSDKSDAAKPEKADATPEDKPDPVIEAHRKRADEIFKDSPSLPANASPKSSEAFSSVKIKAAQDISALEAQLEALTKEKTELEGKLKDPIPADIKSELDDHRTWRAKLDIETDPKFKAFDKAVSDSQEFIYAQLRKSPAITPDVIEKIKSLGGPENVDMEKLFEKIKDPLIQRLVESKMADIEMSKFSKEQAIKSAKENVNQYLTERQKQWEQSATAHNTATQAELDDIVSNIEWMKQKAVVGTDEEKVVATAHNKTVTEIQESLKEGLRDDSPKMRAIMLAGMANLIYLQQLRNREKAAYDSEKTAHEETKKSLGEVNAKLDKFKKVSHIRESGAPPGGKLPEAKKDVDFRPASQAIDDIMKSIAEERQRVSNVG